MANQGLNAAKKAKNDEFYTQLTDIQEELRHYKGHFRGKTVLCNCDDPHVSMFFHYFAYNFETLGLKRLITTCYKSQERDLFSTHDCERAIWLEYFGDRNGNRVPDPDEIGIHELQGDGDFRSPECIELLKQADIVVTNPPFSLFREYLAQLMEYGKKFLRWFQTINIAGEKLTDQELRNAVYAGPWTSDAKRHFSRNGCPAQKIASAYMDGSPIRQDYLETALRWIGNGADPRFYMAVHQRDPNANPLWLYF